MLLAGYAAGCFPMDVAAAAASGEPVGLYEADPRAVLPIVGFRVPRTVARARRRAGFEIRVDSSFRAVLERCAEERPGVWLTPRLIDAYVRLHRLGYAHSVEAWRDGHLSGGLFGVSLGGLFTSESMFHLQADAGSVVLAATADLLRERAFALWDIQMMSPHTARFGAEEIERGEYRRRLRAALRIRPGRLPRSR